MNTFSLSTAQQNHNHHITMRIFHVVVVIATIVVVRASEVLNVHIRVQNVPVEDYSVYLGHFRENALSEQRKCFALQLEVLKIATKV